MNTFGFGDHTDSVATVSSAVRSAKAAVGFTYKWAWLCSNKTLFINTSGGPDLGCRP